MYRSIALGVVAGCWMSVPVAAAAAWTRTYSYGAGVRLSTIAEAPLIDDSAMPLKTLTKIEIFVDNQDANASTTFAMARCCYRQLDNVDPPGFACGAFVSGPKGKGTKTITLTGASLDHCKGLPTTPAGDRAYFLNFSVSATADAKEMRVTAVRTTGS